MSIRRTSLALSAALLLSASAYGQTANEGVVKLPQDIEFKAPQPVRRKL
jgi:hypothetical protein